MGFLKKQEYFTTFVGFIINPQDSSIRQGLAFLGSMSIPAGSILLVLYDLQERFSESTEEDFSHKALNNT